MLLEQALSDTSPDPDRIAELHRTLETAYAEEEAFWRQRSRIQWLKDGDKNSSFFHAVTRGRRARNKFSVIENEYGQNFYEEDHIVDAFSLFYQHMFSAGNTDASSVVREARRLFPRKSLLRQINNLFASLIKRKLELRSSLVILIKPRDLMVSRRFINLFGM